jgi:hypothetical protein
MSFTCSRCGEKHDLPLSFAFEAPVYSQPEDKRPHTPSWRTARH